MHMRSLNQLNNFDVGAAKQTAISSTNPHRNTKAYAMSSFIPQTNRRNFDVGGPPLDVSTSLQSPAEQPNKKAYGMASYIPQENRGDFGGNPQGGRRDFGGNSEGRRDFVDGPSLLQSTSLQSPAKQPNGAYGMASYIPQEFGRNPRGGRRDFDVGGPSLNQPTGSSFQGLAEQSKSNNGMPNFPTQANRCDFNGTGVPSTQSTTSVVEQSAKSYGMSAFAPQMNRRDFDVGGGTPLSQSTVSSQGFAEERKGGAAMPTFAPQMNHRDFHDPSNQSTASSPAMQESAKKAHGMSSFAPQLNRRDFDVGGLPMNQPTSFANGPAEQSRETTGASFFAPPKRAEFDVGGTPLKQTTPSAQGLEERSNEGPAMPSFTPQVNLRDFYVDGPSLSNTAAPCQNSTEKPKATQDVKSGFGNDEATMPTVADLMNSHEVVIPQPDDHLRRGFQMAQLQHELASTELDKAMARYYDALTEAIQSRIITVRGELSLPR